MDTYIYNQKEAIRILVYRLSKVCSENMILRGHIEDKMIRAKHRIAYQMRMCKWLTEETLAERARRQTLLRAKSDRNIKKMRINQLLKVL